MIIRGYITAYFITDRISSLRSHIGSRLRLEPICDQGLDMRSDIKYAVIYSFMSHLNACYTTFVSHSTSRSSAVIGQLK